jgi:hypothetical protein
VVRDGDPDCSGFVIGNRNLVLRDTRRVCTIDGANGARDYDKAIVIR